MRSVCQNELMVPRHAQTVQEQARAAFSVPTLSVWNSPARELHAILSDSEKHPCLHTSRHNVQSACILRLYAI